MCTHTSLQQIILGVTTGGREGGGFRTIILGSRAKSFQPHLDFCKTRQEL